MGKIDLGLSTVFALLSCAVVCSAQDSSSFGFRDTKRPISDAGQATLEHIDTLFDGKIPASATPSERLSFIQRFRREDAPALFAKFARNRTYYTATLVASAYPYLTRLAALRDGAISPLAKYVSASSKRVTEQLLVKYAPDMAPEKIEAERKPFEEYLGLVGDMNRAGVPLLTGTDLATSVFYPGFSLHDELDLLVKSGLTPAAAINAATVNPARLFGRASIRFASLRFASLRFAPLRST